MLGTARESKTLEFKRMMPAKGDKEAIQFLSAVTAFANSAGGDLVIGIDSEDGIATLISGIPLAGYDGYKLHLEQLLASNVEPRLPPVAFHSVECGNNNHVVIIRIPQSWQAPHRVSKDNKFYGRHSSGKYPLDVSELRTAFALRESVAERMRQFRQARLLKIMNGETPSQMERSASLVLHAIPIPSFGDRRLINIAEVLNAQPVTMPIPLGSQGSGSGISLDGVFVYSGPSITQSHGYGLLFRDGSMEGVKQLSVNDGAPYLAGAVFEQDIVRTLRSYTRTCAELEAGFPMYVGVSICHARGVTLREASQGFWATSQVTLNDEVVVLPECMVDNLDADLPTLLKPIFDMIWNAFGYLQSPKYNQQGKWIGTV